MKVLLVEDNERVAQFVLKGLAESGHTTDYAATGRDGMFLAASEPYDAIILDRMLPGDIDGLMGLSFRSADESGGRAYQQAPTEDRWRFRAPAAAHGA
jgi:DNA-binding response OmpR family regulator